MIPTHIANRLFLAITFISFLFTSHAQELPQVIPPSPTVANLMTLEEVPVDYHTGQPSIAIPLFSKQVNKDLVISGALQYSTQGVKIDSRSGWEGTGWSLNAGGVISRTVRGFPDESQDVDKLGVFHNDDFWNYDQLNPTEKSEFNWDAMGLTIEHFDTQIDLYQYSFPGGSGRFVIDKSSGSLEPHLMTSGERFKIDLYNTSTFELDSFKITDTKGLQYFFTEIETGTPEPFTASSLQSDPEVGLVYASGGSGTGVRTAWHLSRIVTSNNKLLVTYEYQASGETYTLSKTITENIITSSHNPGFYLNVCNQENLKPRKVASYLSISGSTFKPTAINFLDGSRIEFEIHPSLTHPETSGDVLQNVVMKGTNGTVQKKYVLEHEILNSRLWLNNVTENDLLAETSRDYGLVYFQKQNLPAFDSPHDDWGFIDPGDPQGNPNLPTLFDVNKIKTGLLTQIIYPTGGSQEFTWENNTFSFGAGDTLSYDQIIQNPDNYTQLIHNIIIDTVINTPATIYSGTIDIDYDQTIYIDVMSLTANDQTVIDEMVLKIKDGNSVEHVNFDVSDGFISGEVPAGVMDIEILTLTNVNNSDIDGHIRIYHYELNPTLLEFHYGGGPRIKEVKLMDGLETKKHIIYDYNDRNSSARSSGSVDGILGSLKQEYDKSVIKYMFGDNGGSCMSGTNDGYSETAIQYHIVSDGLKVQLSKGNYVGYKNVRVSESGNGYSDYEYMTSHDFPNSAQVLDFPFLAPNYLDHKRGMLIEKNVFDEQSRILVNERTQYETSEIDLTYSRQMLDYEGCAWLQHYATHGEFLNKTPSKIPICAGGVPCLTPASYQNCGGGTPVVAVKDTIKIGWSRPIEVLTKQFFYDAQSNKDSVVRKQTFEYNTTNYQVSRVKDYSTEAGDSVFILTRNYYPVGTLPVGYTETSGVDALNAINRISDIIYSDQIRIEGHLFNSPSYTISTTKNVYDSLSNGIVALTEVYAAKGDDPLEKRIQIHQYDDYGNIVEVSKVSDSADDVHTVYLWGYNSTVPVVKIDNVSWTDIPAFIRDGIGTVGEGVVISYVNSLRTIYFPEKQITSYLYNESGNMKEVKDPNNQTTSYEYDGIGRLLRIRDHNGNLVQEVTYKTKN